MKLKRIKLGDAVIVTWVDAVSVSQWLSVADIDPPTEARCPDIVSAGRLLQRDKRQITLASTFGEGGMVGEVIGIPLRMVISMVRDEK